MTETASPTTGQGQQPPDFESKQQLATRLSVSTRTVDNLMVRGLPYVAITGKLRRFPRAEVDAWLRQFTIRRR
jgi:excisionase family DNA binding protein